MSIHLRIARTARACLFFALPMLLHGQAPTQIPTQTQAQSETLALRRAQTLTHGINASGWFGGWGDYSPHHTSTYITAQDLHAMHAMGIRYIRFPLDPVLLTQGGILSAHKTAIWKRIDDALDLAMNEGLAIDLVVFPTDDYKRQLASQDGADRFLMLWQVLARHFADRDPDRFFFELMNESEVQDSYRWAGLQNAVVAAIRAIDTRHTILASGAHYDSIEDLLAIEPLADPNVIYTFHFYEPYAFTHQGASWGSTEWNYYKDIPYPATPAQLEAQLKAVPGDLARYRLFLYAAAGWNRTAISQRLAFPAAWARTRNVPLVCNEFGAFRDTAPPDSRSRYLTDVRSALEENGIGWAMWDWSGNFGLVHHETGKLVPDSETVKALGLQLP